MLISYQDILKYWNFSDISKGRIKGSTKKDIDIRLIELS